MSVKQMALVWELDLPANKKFILLAYADHADEYGEHVFPSLGRIAHKTGYSRDQVRRISKDLKETGLMKLVEEATPTRAAEYRLLLEGGSKLPPLKKRGVANEPSPRGANDPPPVGAPVPPESSIEPSVNHQLLGGDEKSPPKDKEIEQKNKNGSDVVSPGQYAYARIEDILSEARAQGWDPQTCTSKGELAKFYKAAFEEGTDPEMLDQALWWLVTKASGKFPGEPRAWAYFGKALDKVKDGWRRNGSSTSGDEDKKKEWARQHAELAAKEHEFLKGMGLVK